MSQIDIAMAVLFLIAFVIVPAVFIQLGSRRKHISRANIQECPSCGADNYQGRDRCYCCGYDLTNRPGEQLLDRVRRADENRLKPKMPAETSQAIKN